MESQEQLASAIAMAEQMASGDSGLSPLSPVGVDSSRNELVHLAQEYGDVEDEDTYRIADIGCGDGTLTADIAEAYPTADVLGIDLSGKHALLNTYDLENVTTVGGDMYDVLPELSAFDFAYAINVLPATNNPEDALDLFYDSIREGGHLAVTVPNTDGLPAEASRQDTGTLRYDVSTDLPYLAFDGEINGQDVSAQQYVFPRDRAEQLFESAGFTVSSYSTLQTNSTAIPLAREFLGIDPEDDDTGTDRPETVDLYILEK